MTEQEQIAYNAGYKKAVDKAAEWIKEQTELDVPISTNKNGEINTEEYLNNLQAATNQLEKVIREFKEFMKNN